MNEYYIDIYNMIAEESNIKSKILDIVSNTNATVKPEESLIQLEDVGNNIDSLLKIMENIDFRTEEFKSFLIEALSKTIDTNINIRYNDIDSIKNITITFSLINDIAKFINIGFVQGYLSGYKISCSTENSDNTDYLIISIIFN